MTDRTVRALTLGLLASTALAVPAFAQEAPPPADPANQPSTVVASDSDADVIVVTATKREESGIL